MTKRFKLDDASAVGDASPAMRPAVAWGLAGSLLATAWALWWPTEPAAPPVAAADASFRTSPRVASGSTLGAAAPSSSAVPASAAFASVDLPTLSPAMRDPFNLPPPPPPPDAAKAAADAARQREAAPPPPPPPAPPPMSHVVVGRFQAPDGQILVFVQDKAQAVIATPGVELSTGYVIEAVTPREIRLRHPLAEQSVSLSLRDDNPR